MTVFNNSPEDNLTINEAVEVLSREGYDVSEHKLREYEKKGLLAPKKSLKKYRLYSDEDLADIREILALIVLGFSIKEIKLYFSLKFKAVDIANELILADKKIIESSQKLDKAKVKQFNKANEEHLGNVFNARTKLEINKSALIVSRYIDFCKRLKEAIERKKRVIELINKSFIWDEEMETFELVLKSIQERLAKK